MVVPSLVFQATLVGGGYATGRELVEFFLQLGPAASLMAVAVAVFAMSIVSAACFEFARVFAVYDYRLFFRKLLGRFWLAFEAAFLSLIVLILSVLGSACGELFAITFGVSPIWGVFLLLTTVGVLTYFGSRVIEITLATWSIFLCTAYGVLIVWTISVFDVPIHQVFAESVGLPSIIEIVGNGLTYAGYNVVAIVAVIFVARHFARRSDAIIAGVLCGPLGMLPAVLLLVAMSAHYPQINELSLPIFYLIEKLQSPVFIVVMSIAIVGTLIQTGSAMLHSLNERISNVFAEHSRQMPKYMRAAISVTTLLVSVFLATSIGIVELISQGYTYITYVFYAVFLLPILTKGIWMIRNAGLEATERE